MKAILTLIFLLFSTDGFAATWKVEIRDQQTSEIKTYKFSRGDEHKLELSKFEFQGCLIRISEPIKVDDNDQFPMAQMADVQCFSPTGGIFIKSVCSNFPSELEKARTTIFEIAEDGAKLINKKGKKGKFSSYVVTIKCE